MSKCFNANQEHTEGESASEAEDVTLCREEMFVFKVIREFAWISE